MMRTIRIRHENVEFVISGESNLAAVVKMLRIYGFILKFKDGFMLIPVSDMIRSQ